jgi:hypothetical protein
VDWLQNVLATGSAVLVHAGASIPVDQPEVVPLTAVEHLFPPSEQRTHRVFGVRDALRLRRVDVDAVS